jgi:2-C-methyl-D-erythritol 4-phosphate cytidylyltransferase
MSRLHALIPAAGRSVRFGGTTLKQYAHLLGRPVIAHSIEAVGSHPRVATVTVALAPDDGIFASLITPYVSGIRTVDGGESRAHTVMNGLNAIVAAEGRDDWVMVHDAARPCLDRASLDRLLDAGLASDNGAILAMPVNDTLKRAGGDGRIVETVDRSEFWGAQTPQLFPLGLLADQLEEALAAGDSPTDEAAAMERGGFRPLLVRGAATNIKITGADDLALADYILRHQCIR